MFQRAISQSGVANAPWALQPHALKNAQKLAKLVDCPSNDKREMIDCLKKAPARTLVEAFSKGMVTAPFLPMTFVPRIDKEAKKPFLPEHPLALMKEGRINKVPWMTGVAREEGLGFVYGKQYLNSIRIYKMLKYNEESILFCFSSRCFAGRAETRRTERQVGASV